MLAPGEKTSVREYIKGQMSLQKSQEMQIELTENAIKDLRKEATIKILDEKYKS